MKACIIIFVLIVAVGCSGDIQKVTFTPAAGDQERIESIDGFADFIVGESPFHVISGRYEKKDWKTNSFALCYKEDWTFLFNCKWYELYKDLEYKDKDEIATILTKNNLVRSIALENYKVGDMLLKNFYLAFYNDTLVAIQFEPDIEDREDMRNHYVEKYGSGNGFSNTYDLMDAMGRYTNKEHREWDNHSISLTYDRFKFIDKREGYNMDENIYFYAHKRLYPLFLDEITREVEGYIKKQEEDKEASLSAF